MTLNICCAQLVCEDDKQKNLEKIEKWMSVADKLEPDLVVFPEMFMFYSHGRSKEYVAERAEPMSDSAWIRNVGRVAREHGTNVIVGMYERELDSVYNTTIWLNKEGELEESYRKTHLYDAFGYRESDIFSSGKALHRLCKIKDFRFGLCVCYEVRFPEVSRSYAVNGADLVVMPTAWVQGALKEDTMATLCRARAIENTMYFAVAGQVGRAYSGMSAIYDPMGVSIARGTETECLLSSELTRSRIEDVRRQLPCLDNRHPDLYRDIASDSHAVTDRLS